MIGTCWGSGAWDVGAWDTGTWADVSLLRVVKINNVAIGLNNITPAQITELIGGGETTLHAHAYQDTLIYTEPLADDTVYSFTPRTALGIIIVCQTGSQAGIENVVAFYNTATPSITSFVIGSASVVGTGALTNGTANGTDAKMNVNTYTDGKIYIKNRLGASRAYFIQIFSA